MFDNVGGKIKELTRWICLISMAAFVITGLVIMISDSFFGGLLTAVVGAAGAWAGSFVLYGFGELVESAMVLRDAELKRQHEQEQKPEGGRRSRTRTQSEQSSGYSLSQLAAQREAKTTGWRCKKCGKMNTTTALYCVDCGGDR